MIQLHNVSCRLGDGVTVIDDVSLHIAPGAFCVLVGPSGAGKSTLLRLVNRLVPCTQGRILVGGTDIDSVRPEILRRRIGYAIQSVGLFPHWNVARNIAAVPRLLRWPAPLIAARVAELMALLRLDPALATRYPRQLSGGQLQRVGLARALAADPELLLMDEPLGALDPPTRAALQQNLVELHRRTGKTMLMVTHDMAEARALATQLVVLRAGRVVQNDTPARVMAAPADDFVRDFLQGPAA